MNIIDHIEKNKLYYFIHTDDNTLLCQKIYKQFKFHDCDILPNFYGEKLIKLIEFEPNENKPIQNYVVYFYKNIDDDLVYNGIDIYDKNIFNKHYFKEFQKIDLKVLDRKNKFKRLENES